MKKAAFLFFRVEVGNAACAVQYLVVVQTMLVRCPKNLDFTVFQKVSLSNLIFLNACLPLIRFDLTFATYYEKKRAEGKKHRVAITHVAKKLIRVIYALERQDVDFNAQKLR